MKADAVPLLALFEKKMRLEVPLFQRQYVWNQEDQWEPLWEDIQRKFVEYLEGRKDAPVHFLGAMVLDQKQTPSTHVEKRQVIDGQQRLTTLQIFLAALRDFCREQKCDELAQELDGYTLNKGMMADPQVERFKVWPTQLDRQQFQDVIGLGSRAAIEKEHPVRRKKHAHKPDPRPRMVEAYILFSDRIREFFLGTEAEPPMLASAPLSSRLEETFQALKHSLQVVTIDLERDDDAQVIFETLNSRGEPLLPADLLRNFIFLRAGRLKEPAEQLYDEYWSKFDDEFWRQEVRQGRLIRPRSDLFMQHFLASQQTVDVPIKHLFVEYKFWIERKHPFATVTEELKVLAQQRDNFRRLIEPRRDDPVFELATFLESFDVRTVYPLLLFLLESGLSKQQWSEVTTILESYLVRRSVLGLTTKSYNRIFLNLTRQLRTEGAAPANLRKALSTHKRDSAAWPTDADFERAWSSANAYELKNPRVVHIFKRLDQTYLTKLNEAITIDRPVTVEHILPQNWVTHWPLACGQQGLKEDELGDAPAEDVRTTETNARNQLLHTFGNLTIITQELNSTVSNAPWGQKRPALMQASLLPINQDLGCLETWNDAAIAERGKRLFDRALQLWPGPESR